jgi:hypothetical protein
MIPIPRMAWGRMRFAPISDMHPHPEFPPRAIVRIRDFD